MQNEPQIAATQDKNYLKALAPLIFTAAIFCNDTTYAMAMRPYVKLVQEQHYTAAAKPRTNNTPNTWSENSKAQQQQFKLEVEDTPQPQEEEPVKKAEDKNIDPDDQDNDGNVREAIPLWEKKSLNHQSWSEHIYRELPELGPALLASNPVDAKIFCPNYKNLEESERKQFWAFFISSMAKFESNFDPKEAYTEGFRDSAGRYVISRGLLQISIESSKGYHCGFTSEKQLHDPTRNLSCGIIILNHWMKKDARIASRLGVNWKGGARYWSVLRAGRKTSYQSIVKWSNDLPFCKL
ncbi:MAG: transglycosylase SLT domain-containing protein [Pseudobdellovibrio sp.]|nr:transglycosylase SLT domain-containing protein [Pseudobdellovibrio sp.]